MNSDMTRKFMKLVLFGMLIIMEGQKSCRAEWASQWHKIQKDFILELDEV